MASMPENLPQWDLARLFPEGGDITNVPALSARVEAFYAQRHQEGIILKKAVSDALASQQPEALERHLEQWIALHLELQRVRDFCHLLQQQTNNPALLELKSKNVEWFDSAFSPLQQIATELEALPREQVNEWMRQAPDLVEADKIIGIWNKEQFAKPLSLAQREALHPLRIQKYTLQNDYMMLHQNGPIASADNAAREKIAQLFGKLGQLNWDIAKASGNKTPLEGFAGHEYISPQHLERLWYSTNRLSETSDHISDLLQDSFDGKKEALKQLQTNKQTKSYSWQEARQIITEALTKFHPDLKPILDEAFENGWIHAAPRPNSTGNAFTMPGASRNFYGNGHPYILAEFDGSLEKIVTLAHELGHACSHVLAQQKGHLSGAHSTLMQESFAVMSETLVLHHMLAQAQTPLDQAMITRTILKRSQSAIFSQIGHVNFENALYNAAAQQITLSPTQLDTLWQQSMMHTPLPNNADARNGWTNIHHYFSHDPYYMMGYVLAGLSANTLANRWQQSTPENKQAIANQWLDIMRSGTNTTPEHMLEQMNIALDSSSFYHSNRQYFHGLMQLYTQSMENLSSKDLNQSFSISQPIDSGKQWLKNISNHARENLVTNTAVRIGGMLSPYIQPASISASPHTAMPSNGIHSQLPNFADRVQDARLISDGMMK